MPGRNGGRLLAGGKPGHPGAGGRPTNKARDLCLKGYLKAIPFMSRIAQGTERVTLLDAKGQPVRDEKGRIVKVPPKLRESRECFTELGNRCIGSKVEVDAPLSPINVTVVVSQAVADERAAEARMNGHPK